MEIKLYHSLEYTTKGTVPVRLVADSLLANEALIYESLRFLEELHKDVQISSIRISVLKLSNASPLSESMAIALLLSLQKDLVDEVPQIIEQLTGYQIPDGYDATVTVLVMFLALYLIAAIIERTMPGKSVKAIKEEYEDKKQLVANILRVSPERIEGVVNQKYKEGKKKLLVSVVRGFFSPAKIETGVEITAGNGLKIPSKAIDEIPSDLDYLQMDAIKTYDLRAATVEIHRADRDETKHGWRAVIRQISDKKIRMELDPPINPDALYGEKILRGDVTVVEEMQENGDYEVKVYHLRGVRD